jgi:hypothetical protein
MTEKIKRLSPEILRDLKEKNALRRMYGLRQLVIKVRRCLACNSLFESLGNGTCGCRQSRGN